VGRDLTRLYEVTAKVCADTRDHGRAKGQPCTGFVPTPAAGHPRGRVNTDREANDASVDQAHTLVAGPRRRPPRPSRWRGGEQSAADQSLSRRGLLRASEKVEKARGGPASDRDVGEQWVDGMAQATPRTVARRAVRRRTQT
jgi:hypothetical protein